MTRKALDDFNKKCVGGFRLYDTCFWGATVIDNDTGDLHDIIANDCGGDFHRIVLNMCGYTGDPKDVLF